MKKTPLIFIVLGLIILWFGGVKGNIGSLLAVFFDPSSLEGAEKES